MVVIQSHQNNWNSVQTTSNYAIWCHWNIKVGHFRMLLPERKHALWTFTRRRQRAESKQTWTLAVWRVDTLQRKWTIKKLNKRRKECILEKKIQTSSCCRNMEIYVSFYLPHISFNEKTFSMTRIMDVSVRTTLTVHCTFHSVFYHLPFVINPRHIHDRIKKETKINIKRMERKKIGTALDFFFVQEK